MINVDEVTASRLIFAPMGVFFGKCCGNATLRRWGAQQSVQLRPTQSILALTARPMLLARTEEYRVQAQVSYPRCSVGRDYLAEYVTTHQPTNQVFGFLI